MNSLSHILSVCENEPVIKICGLQTVEAAKCALESGANLIGIICVPNRKRTIESETAIEISELIHAVDEYNDRCLVGVFRNQTKEEVKELAFKYNVDIVQLHGDENWQEYYDFIGKPIIKRVVFPRDCDEVISICQSENVFKCLPLFDSEAGGTGEKLDWNSISNWSETCDPPVKFILAGGLTPDNVNEATKLFGVIGCDVSGGVETDNLKDMKKIRLFVSNGKKI